MFDGNDARPPRGCHSIKWSFKLLHFHIYPHSGSIIHCCKCLLPLVANEDNNSAVEMAPLDVDVTAAKKKVRRCLISYISQFFTKQNI